MNYKKYTLCAIYLISILLFACTSGEVSKDSIKHEIKTPTPTQQRKIAVQTFDFRHFSLEETCDMLSSINIYEIQCYNGQKLFKNSPEKFGHKSPESVRENAKKLLKDKGFKIVSYGPVSEVEEDGIKTAYEFAKEFNIPELVIEPKDKSALKIYNKYAKEYGIKTGVHHHGMKDPYSDYYHPRLILEAAEGLEFIGVVPDQGHWTRSGYDVIECFKMIEGKIVNVHLKDKNKFDDLKAVCVPYGTGVIDFDAIFAELDRQGYDGYYIIEYEQDKENPLPAVKKSVEFVRAHPKKLR